jgi:transglutaminase-like putative cysteine protease
MLALLLLVPGAASADEKHWQRVMAGERKVGFVEHSRRVAGDRVFVSEKLTLELGKAGRRVTYRVTLVNESTMDGTLLHLVREARTREGHSLLDARRVGPDLVIDIGAGARKQTRTLPAGTLRTEEYAREWLRSVGSGAQPAPLEYLAFDPTRLVPANVTFSPLPAADGRYRARRVTRIGGSETSSVVVVDPTGHVIEESMRLGGLELRLVGSSEAEALARGDVLDHVVGQMQKSPYRIPGDEMRAKIRYGFEHGGRVPAIPVGGGQRSWTDGPTTWIQVCASCALDAAELSGDERVNALAATPWLDYEDASLTRRAQRLTFNSDDPAKKMAQLARFVRDHMSVQQIDMLGYGSAREAFASRRGDCTEYAVLLAAMGRAAGVPTRVVSGMVYARHFEGQRHVFVPHAWAQAWTGSGWQSFDAALGKFDSTHLAFAVSYDGNPAELFAGLNLAHRLKLRSAARVVPRVD